ncbi:MAG: hypothetical protein U0165_06290 [Polyangiaceae bacterium]
MSNERVSHGSMDALDALLLQQFSSSGRWSSLLIAGSGLTFQALSMMILRGVDGPKANLDGILARAVTWFVVGAALPTALGLARMMNAWPGEPWLVVLAKMRGISPLDVARRAPFAAFRIVIARSVLMLGPLVLLSMLLSLAEPGAATHRALSGALFLGLGLASALFLVAAGWVGARWLGGRGRLLILVLLIVPGIFTGASRGLPRYFSPSGAYVSANEAVQRFASHDR